jgi:hypothetical protein
MQETGLAKIPNGNWSQGWQKDNRFSKNATEKLIVQATGKDTQLRQAYDNDDLLVNAGPHRKAGAGGGGDARWHISVRKRGGSGWHILLNQNCSSVIGIEKRERVTGGF